MDFDETLNFVLYGFFVDLRAYSSDEGYHSTFPIFIVGNFNSADITDVVFI